MLPPHSPLGRERARASFPDGRAIGQIVHAQNAPTRIVGIREHRDIVLYFRVENALLNSAGMLLGCLLALGIGQWLSVQDHPPRLDLYYLLGGVLALWIIGQLAAYIPRAASVPPAVATRTI